MKKIALLFTVALVAFLSACSGGSFDESKCRQILNKDTENWTTSDAEFIADQTLVLLDEFKGKNFMEISQDSKGDMLGEMMMSILGYQFEKELEGESISSGLQKKIDKITDKSKSLTGF